MNQEQITIRCAMEAQNQQDIYDGKRPTFGYNDFIKLNGEKTCQN